MSKIRTARDRYGGELVQYRVILEENETGMAGDGLWISGYGQARDEERGGFWQALLRVLGLLRLW